MSVFDHKDYSSHQDVRFFHDEKSGLKAIIAVHNTNLGPALGGCRMWTYNSSEDALTDVLRLSKGMTYKSAMANLKLGGGKAVIIGDSRKDKSEALMRAMGRSVQSFGGSYITAEDSGIKVGDLQTMAEESDFIAGTEAKFRYDGSPANGDPSPATAYGVFIGIKATVAYKTGESLEGKVVAIQGLGNVGINLAELLHKAGAKLIVADIFPDNIKRAQEEFGAEVVDPEQILSVEADVLAPCALGGAISKDSIDDIKAPIIAGAANNQLSEEVIGKELMARDVIYAPDYVINAGGIIDIYYQRNGGTAEALKEHIEGIGDTLTQIYKRAAAEGKSTNQVANTIAEERFNG